MPLAPGTRLGAYEVLSLLGAGGMGEVYRARDTRLNRDVAIKVISGELAADIERVQRFEQEARSAAALNHPNIVSVFDVGSHSGVPYVVSELLEGETLRERLARGPLLASKAIDYGVQLARGLSAAHEKGIVHRDLKPENIFLGGDNRVKILDFGLAKLTQPDNAVLAVSNMPTTPPNTQAGLVLGTVGYMSPEQVRARPVDQRSDIFALGAVLYEMISGRRAFARETGFETMTAIVNEEVPDLHSADRHIAPALERIIHRCLEKSAAGRFQTAADLAFALEGVSNASAGVHAVAAEEKKSATWRNWRVVGGTLAVAAVIVMAIALIYVRGTRLQAEIIRFSISPPARARFETAIVAPFPAVSPDGKRLALIVLHENRSVLWIRSLDSFDGTILEGTEGAALPFWEPDGRSVGYFAAGKLKKVDVNGGGAQILCDAPGSEGGTWNRDGVIVFGSSNGPLLRVSSDGGQPTPVTKLDSSRHDISHQWPSFLPDGRRFVFHARTGTENRIVLGSLDGAELKDLFAADAKAEYVEPGHLVFVRAGTLFRQPFDASSGRLTGEPTPIAGVRSGVVSGRAAFSASPRVLVYRTARVSDSQLVWFDRTGVRLSSVGEPGLYGDVELSSDDKHVATTIRATATSTAARALWIVDAMRGIRNRFTFGDQDDYGPRWSLTGDQIFFARQRPKPGLHSKPSDNSRDEQLRLELTTTAYADDVSPDGHVLLYEIQALETDWDIWMLPLAGEGKPRPVIAGPLRQEYAQFSPDGRWIAYRSNESGRYEVYASAFPGPGGKRQVSTSGGGYPRWSRDGRELFYVDLENRLVSAEVKHQGTSIDIGTVTPLFEIRRPPQIYPYDVSSDGQRFLVNTRMEESTADPLSVVVNWQEGLKE